MGKRIKLPSIADVRDFVYGMWSLKVRQLDGWKCLLCSSTSSVTAHHWYFCDHFAKAARYCVPNGASLCFACHIHGVHTRADWVTVQKIRAAVQHRFGPAEEAMILRMAETEVTVPLLREMYNDWRREVIELDNLDALVDLRRGKLFLSTSAPHPIAVPGAVIRLPGYGLAEVTVVTKQGKSEDVDFADFAAPERYTVRLLSTEEQDLLMAPREIAL